MKATSPFILTALLACGACAPGAPPAAPPPPAPLDTAAAPETVLPFAGGLAQADTFSLRTLVPGVRHIYARDAAGPWAVHVVEVERGVCQPQLRAVKAGPPLSVRAPTSVLVRDALAGVNADFFMLPGGTPVGLHAIDGRVLAGPGSRPAFASGRAGYAAGVGRIEGAAWHRADSARIDQVNRPLGGGSHQPPAEALTLFTIWGDSLPATGGPAATVVLGLLEGDEAAGRGTVIAVWPELVGLYVRPGEVALRARGPAAAWLTRRELDDTVAWRTAALLEDPGAPPLAVEEAVGGFPVLLRDGAAVLHLAEGVPAGFGPARHPRTAVAWDTAADRLLLVTVDGRQPGYSVGMTLQELTALLVRIGATDAINLDGGGSTAMVVGGRVVNRPSDDVGERSVGNALALASCPAVERPSAGRGHVVDALTLQLIPAVRW
ncbi:MAG: phosphodiester glycosidase family protein [Gemmatimonadota bacterium]